MKHTKQVTLAKAMTAGEKDSDAAGALFFQVWLTVFMWILTGAFGKQ
jgi:hypothetical protein